MKLLLDTCVLSELIAKEPNSSVLEWMRQQSEDDVYLCAITIGEIKHGIERLDDGRRKAALHRWLEQELLHRFSTRLLDVTVGVMMRWGVLVSQREKAGQPMPIMDSLIAAVALEHGCHLVTRNIRDFEGLGLPLTNPWSDTVG